MNVKTKEADEQNYKIFFLIFFRKISPKSKNKQKTTTFTNDNDANKSGRLPGFMKMYCNVKQQQQYNT